MAKRGEATVRRGEAGTRKTPSRRGGVEEIYVEAGWEHLIEISNRVLKHRFSCEKEGDNRHSCFMIDFSV